MTMETTPAADESRNEAANKSFLLTLGDRLLRESDTETILALTCEQLAEELDVSRVAFCELAHGTEVGLITTREWANGVPSFLGAPQRWKDLNPALTTRLEAGEALAVEDLVRDPAFGGHPNCVAREFLDHALIAVPLIRAERLVAYLLVANKHSRCWGEGELHLVKEVAVRTWETLERARAEAKLREGEANQAFLLQLADATRDESDPAEILDRTGRSLQRHLDVGTVAYWETDPDGSGSLLTTQWAGSARDNPASLDARLIARLAETGISRATNLEAENVPGAQALVSNGIAAFLCAPLIKGRGHAAALAVAHHQAREWSESEIHLVQEVAERTRATLQRARAEAELERSREALLQSEKLTALGALLAGVSHELNNPLSVVVGQSLMLEQGAADPETARRAAKIRASAERCARIVRTFLAMARQRPPERGLADIRELIDSAVELTSYGCRASGIGVAIEASEDLPPLHVDSDQMHQVFTNLLVNAQHALQDHDGARVIRITASLLKEGRGVRVRISDSGPGIDPRIQNRIFEPFFTTKPVGSGTGLGLSFAHGVVESHGGKLEFVPREQGATFQITLPLPASSVQSASAERSEGASPMNGVALIVDDELELAETLADFLQKDGWRTVLESSGQGALDRLAEREFDLIVSDVRMPDVGGRELHAWLAAHRPRMLSRLAFLTGDTLGSGAASFLRQAGRPYAEKPFSRESIRRLLSEVEATRRNN